MNHQDIRRRRSLAGMFKQQDVIGGLVVFAVGAFAFWRSADLPIGTLGGMGAGMLPRSLAAAWPARIAAGVVGGAQW